jgi:hypothetical protein
VPFDESVKRGLVTGAASESAVAAADAGAIEILD